MPKKNKNKSINLLPQEEFEGSITGRLLRWAMTTFRFIVIITEMIVMGAFLSRFWLDAKNSDLNDVLRVTASQVSAQSSFEKDFRNLQSRLKVAQDLGKETPASETLGKVMSKVPVEIIIQSFSYQENSLQLKGVSSNEVGVVQFISNLKADKSFKSVELGQIASSEENGTQIVFTIKITY